MTKNKNNQTIWETRIKGSTSTLFKKVGNSIDIDKRLYKEDIAGSIVHVEMLKQLFQHMCNLIDHLNIKTFDHIYPMFLKSNNIILKI